MTSLSFMHLFVFAIIIGGICAIVWAVAQGNRAKVPSHPVRPRTEMPPPPRPPS